MKAGHRKNGPSAAVSPPTTVYVVDDDASVRRSMARLLKSHGFFAQTLACAEDFLALGQYASPGCLVLDVRMPGLNGLELQQRMSVVGISLPIVFITGHGDVPMSVKAMKAGAVDFLPKPFSASQLLHAVRLAIDKNVTQTSVAAEVAEVKRRMSTLTRREAQVMDLVVAGLMNKEVADKLGLSIKTVKVHRGRVMKKMQVQSLAELVRMSSAATKTSR